MDLSHLGRAANRMVVAPIILDSAGRVIRYQLDGVMYDAGGRRVKNKSKRQSTKAGRARSGSAPIHLQSTEPHSFQEMLVNDARFERRFSSFLREMDLSADFEFYQFADKYRRCKDEAQRVLLGFFLYKNYLMTEVLNEDTRVLAKTVADKFSPLMEQTLFDEMHAKIYAMLLDVYPKYLEWMNAGRDDVAVSPRSIFKGMRSRRQKSGRLSPSPPKTPPKSPREMSTLVEFLEDDTDNAFVEFMRKEFAHENIMCYRLIHKFKCESNLVEKAALSVHIYHTFIKPECPKEVNVSHDLRSALETQVAPLVKREIYDEIQEHLFTLMKANNYPAYLAWLKEKPADKPNALQKFAGRLSRSVSGTGSNDDEVGDLKTLLLDVSRNSFEEFLELEHSAENLLCWRLIEKFRCAVDEVARTTLGARIFAAFIMRGAAEEVNISEEMRTAVEPFFPAVTPTLFNQIQKHLFQLMKRDSFPRFLISLGKSISPKTAPRKKHEVPSASQRDSRVSSTLQLEVEGGLVNQSGVAEVSDLQRRNTVALKKVQEQLDEEANKAEELQQRKKLQEDAKNHVGSV